MNANLYWLDLSPPAIHVLKKPTSFFFEIRRDFYSPDARQRKKRAGRKMTAKSMARSNPPPGTPFSTRYRDWHESLGDGIP
jgi:hypothetical protein